MNISKKIIISIILATLIFPGFAFASDKSTYLIITQPMFVETLNEFIDSKQAQGEKVQIKFAYDDTAEEIRDFLADIHETNPDLKNVLIVGSPDKVPIKYVDYVGEYSWHRQAIPTDQYYASLETNWQQGAFDPIFYVGRIPVDSKQDLKAWIQKTINWDAPKNPVHSQFISSYCGVRTSPIYADKQLSKAHEIIFHYCTNEKGGDISEFANLDNADFISSYSHGSFDGVFGRDDGTGYWLNKSRI